MKKAKGPELEKRIHVRVPHTTAMRIAMKDAADAVDNLADSCGVSTGREAFETLSVAMRLSVEPEQLEVVPEMKKAGELTLREVEEWMKDEEVQLHISCRSTGSRPKRFLINVTSEAGARRDATIWHDDLVAGLRKAMAEL